MCLYEEVSEAVSACDYIVKYRFSNIDLVTQDGSAPKLPYVSGGDQGFNKSEFGAVGYSICHWSEVYSEAFAEGDKCSGDGKNGGLGYFIYEEACSC